MTRTVSVCPEDDGSPQAAYGISRWWKDYANGCVFYAEAAYGDRQAREWREVYVKRSGTAIGHGVEAIKDYFGSNGEKP